MGGVEYLCLSNHRSHVPKGRVRFPASLSIGLAPLTASGNEGDEEACRGVVFYATFSRLPRDCVFYWRSHRNINQVSVL